MFCNQNKKTPLFISGVFNSVFFYDAINFAREGYLNAIGVVVFY